MSSKARLVFGPNPFDMAEARTREEVDSQKTEYQKFFQKALKKFGVKSRSRIERC